jgi:hypothetical protein
LVHFYGLDISGDKVTVKSTVPVGPSSYVCETYGSRGCLQCGAVFSGRSLATFWKDLRSPS